MNKQGILTKEQPLESFIEDGIKYVPYRLLPPGDTLQPGERLRGKWVYTKEASPIIEPVEGDTPKLTRGVKL